MKKYLSLIVGLLLLSTTFAQNKLVPAEPAVVGMSPERLQRIDAVMKEYVDKKWIPGASLIIARDGKIVYHKAFGYANLDTRKPLTTDAIFRIASQTKAITAVAVMMLWEEGKFLLDDPIGKYIPEFASMQVLDKFNATDSSYTTVPAKRGITIRDLLTHSSGIGYPQIGSPEANAIYYKNGLFAGLGMGHLLLADQMKILAKMPLMHQPGENWTYGLNNDLLGYLVEVLSGLSLDAFFRTRIFEPLGMNDTYFYLPKSKHQRLVAVSTENEAHESVALKAKTFELNGTVQVDYPNTEGRMYAGGAGLSCTALDYAIFLQMLLNGGTYNGKRLLSPTTVKMMRSVQYEPKGWDYGGTAMGLGVGVVTDKKEGRTPVSPGSFNWGGFFSSSYWADPQKRIVAQLFINQYPMVHGEIHEKFQNLVYQAIVGQ